MASTSRAQILDQLVQQGQVVAQTVLTQLQQQILNLVQNAVGQLSSLVGSIGRFDIDFNQIINQVKPLVAGYVNQVLAQVLGSLQGIIGGRASVDFSEIFNGFLEQITTPIVAIGQHFLNQGLAAVLGSLGGSRGISDIFASLQEQLGAAVTAAQGAISGAIDNLANLGSNILDSSKPHWEQLQEQLVGHGLNALGSISETINNLHGSITGGF
eukprot:TRINITY_DN1957_c0_g1_i1.p1 TRINITY_DN1957_c0_g1~~TRINITY_DN1957_c0_g1_i1.p1  ORF type:complete len:245 (-),score=52.48 TRINITY_DN1957_c0_g1_i1:94-732(-)